MGAHKNKKGTTGVFFLQDAPNPPNIRLVIPISSGNWKSHLSPIRTSIKEPPEVNPVIKDTTPYISFEILQDQLLLVG
jgi:hypothetical protein